MVREAAEGLMMGTTRMRWLFVAGAALLLAGIGQAHADPSDDVGLAVSAATVPARREAIELTLWYPAKPDGRSELYGGSPVFKGVPVRRNASMADGRFPVVVLAHGGLRANPKLSGWLAARLAARGNIVVSVHPPQISDADVSTAVDEVWLRPSDISAALDTVEADPAVATHLDLARVGVVGFFLGGTAALAVAGARLDADRFRRSCDPPSTGPDCGWFAKNGIDLHRVDAAIVARSHLDSRFKIAVVANPELSGELAAESLKAIAVPVLVISLGGVTAEMSGLPKQIPNARHAVVSDASPFSAFNPCAPRAAAILAEEGEDDAICRDGGNRSREELQAEIGDIIEAALAAVFLK